MLLRTLFFSRLPSIASELQEACFNAMWCCINENQRVTLSGQLSILMRQNITIQLRNDTLSYIDTVLHLTDGSNHAAFMTILRELSAPGVRAMHFLAHRGCLIMHDSVATLSDANMCMVEAPFPLSQADSGSHGSGLTTIDSAGVSQNSGSLSTIFVENLDVVQVMADDLPVESLGTFQCSNTPGDSPGPAKTFFDSHHEPGLE